MIYIGLDLGQAADFTAQAVVDYVTETGGAYTNQVTDSFMDLVKLSRFSLGTSYTGIIDSIREFVVSEPFRLSGNKLRNYRLIVDGTGVGRPVVDLCRRARLNVTAVTITGGTSESFDQLTGYWNVGKALLVSNTLVRMETGKLRIAKDIEEAETLRRELANFKMKISISGNDTFEAWREKDHDDTVLAACLAVWYAEYHGIAGDPEHPTPKPHPLTNPNCDGIL